MPIRLRRRSLLCLVVLLVGFPTSADAWQPEPAKPAAKITTPRLDFLGDPLPNGAIARFGTLRMRHQGPVLTAVFSPDGKWVASAGERGAVVHLWDADTGKEIWRFAAGKAAEKLYDGVGILAFSPDGKKLAAGLCESEGSHLLVLDAATGKLLFKGKNHDARILAVAFVDDGKKILAADSKGTVLWSDATSGMLLQSWRPLEDAKASPDKEYRGKFYGAAFSPDGRGIAIHTWTQPQDETRPEEKLVVFDLMRRTASWRAAAEGYRGYFGSEPVPEFRLETVVFSPDAQLLAFGTSKGVSVCDAATGKERYKFTEATFRRAAFMPDCKALAVATVQFDSYSFNSSVGTRYFGSGKRDMNFYDAASGKHLRSFSTALESESDVPRFLAFSPDGNKVICNGREREVIIWKVAVGKQVSMPLSHHHGVYSARFSQNGTELVSGSGGWWLYPQTVISWDLATGKLIQSSEVKNSCFAALDHSLVVRFSDDNSLNLFNRSTGTLIRQLDPATKTLQWRNGYFSPSGKLFLIQNAVESVEWALQDTESGKELLKFQSTGDGWLRATGGDQVIFAPDERRMAWYELDGTVRVVEVATGNTLHRLNHPRPAASAELDPSTLADSAKWRRVALAFSPTGRHLATWDSEVRIVHVWDLTNKGKLIWKLKDKDPGGSLDEKCCLTFSPDGRTLAMGGFDGDNDIRLWEVSSGRLRLVLTGHRAPVASLAFSPNGRLLASGSADTTVLVWDVWSTGER